MTPLEPHISAVGLARQLGITPQTLSRWRRKGTGPQGWWHLNTTTVVYPQSGVSQWIADQKAAANAADDLEQSKVSFLAEYRRRKEELREAAR